ncbi:hypothetical protein KBB45_09680 [Myxococcota bacterium]|nr:hypothetical protein [Myxococcota bacterium]
MRLNGLLIACLFLAGSFAACGGVDVGNACLGNNDCVPGEVCRDLQCTEVKCLGAGDCNNANDEICVPGALVGKDPEFRFCTAAQCKTDGSLNCPEGSTCKNGWCERDPGTDIDAVEPDNGDRPDDGDTDPGEEPDVPPVAEGGDCKSCAGDGDCNEGFKCLPLGSDGKYCLRPCEDHKDCLSGYQCYQASSVLKACVPNTYNCVACAFDAPCGEGMCCDFTSGECKECRQECDPCTYDYDCAGNMRCFKKAGNPTGACVEECEKDNCSDPANFTCQPNHLGVRVCQPNDDSCGGCPAGTFPLPDGTGCVECLNTSHCTGGASCDLTTNTCVVGACDDRTPHTCSDGECHQCCEDAHCAGIGTGVCKPTFECEGAELCGGTCAHPYPICAIVDGTEMCVQCKTDADCHKVDATCYCTREPLYACNFPDQSMCMTEGGACMQTCKTDNDCPPSSDGGELYCDTVGEICYDSSGKCDGMYSCCPAGEVCFDLMSLLMGGGMGGMPGMPEEMGVLFGYCSCNKGTCLGGGTCTPTAMACLMPMIGDIICPGGSLAPNVPQNICFDIMGLLGGII